MNSSTNAEEESTALMAGLGNREPTLGNRLYRQTFCR